MIRTASAAALCYVARTTRKKECIPTLRRDYRLGIVTSDLATEQDIRRMRALGVPTLQVVTGKGIDVFCEWLRAKEALQSLQVASRTLEARVPDKPRVRYN